jgi:protein TonB
MRAKTQGKVGMRAIVLRDGHVGLVEVIEPLDPELDRQAVMALRQWEFKPGTRDGKPVAVRITCDMAFSLSK